MIRLKILAVLFSMVVAVTEEFNIVFPDNEAAAVNNSQTSKENTLLTSIKSTQPERPDVTPAIPTTITNFTVTASVYFPEPNQTDSTPFITADGSKISKKNPKKHRWIAVSRDLHARWGGELNYGDSLLVTGVSENMDGIYIVKDVMNRRMKNKIDILVGRQDKIMGLWHDVQLARLD